jgi:hypothetical protein
MWKKIWSVLLDERYQGLLKLVGGAVAAIVVALFTLYNAFYTEHQPKPREPPTTKAAEKTGTGSALAPESNRQATPQITRETVLLNILRAAYREPLQFTDSSPISAQAVANYRAAGLSVHVLLPLFVSEIKFDEPGQISVFRNTGSTAASFFGFRFLTKQLVEKGLDIAATKEAALCFRSKQFPLKEAEPDYEVSKKIIDFHANVLKVPGRRDIELPYNIYCDVSKQPALNSSPFTLRSVGQTFNFLGNLVRLELGLNDGNPTDLQLPGHYTDQSIPLYLFKVAQRLPLNGEISANFRGKTYTVAADPTGADASSQVLAILTELVDVQSSAKSLPPPSADASTR